VNPLKKKNYYEEIKKQLLPLENSAVINASFSITSSSWFRLTG
jgi:hypothetical protein